jgi:hydrogenase small subunit
MAASGHQAEEALSRTVAEGGYILVIEGSIPLAEDGLYCTIGGRPFKDIVRECAASAAAIVCVGSCATYGGIPRSGPTDAVGYLFRGTQKHHYYDDVGDKPVINLPTSPVHPERLVAITSPLEPFLSWINSTGRWLFTARTSTKTASGAVTSMPENS